MVASGTGVCREQKYIMECNGVISIIKKDFTKDLSLAIHERNDGLFSEIGTQFKADERVYNIL